MGHPVQILEYIPSVSDAMNDTFWMAWNRVTNQRNDCFNPCMIVLTSVGGKNLITVSVEQMFFAYDFSEANVYKL